MAIGARNIDKTVVLGDKDDEEGEWDTWLPSEDEIEDGKQKRKKYLLILISDQIFILTLKTAIKIHWRFFLRVKRVSLVQMKFVR